MAPGMIRYELIQEESGQMQSAFFLYAQENAMTEKETSGIIKSN